MRQENIITEAPPFLKVINSEIILKLLEPTDASALFYTIYANKHYLYPWLPWVENTKSIIDARAFIEDSLQKYARGETIIAGIWKEHQLIGCIGFNEINHLKRRATIGYWLAKHYQGKGIITNACRSLIDDAFNEMDLNRVEILCAVQNYKSRGVAKRLGFTEEAISRNYLHMYDDYINVILYSMQRANWKNIKI